MSTDQSEVRPTIKRPRGRPPKNAQKVVMVKKEYEIPEADIIDTDVMNELKADMIKQQKLVKPNAKKGPVKVISLDSTKSDEPPAKRPRGRRPNPRPPPDQIEPSSLSNTSLQNNVILKKPRKPRQEKQAKRKPYKKHQKKVVKSVVVDPESGKYMIQPDDEEGQNNDIPEASLAGATLNDDANASKKNENFNQQIFNNFFNKRLIKNTSIIDESALKCFRILDMLREYNEFNEKPELMSKIEDLDNNFKILYNRFESLEKNLGGFLIKLLRGYMASKICPIPIQTPWALRTEVMDNENKTWMDLQRQIDLFVNFITNANYQCEELTDEELLKQKTSSFFLGRGADSTKIPPYIYNSEWLITDTGAKGDIETIIVGGSSSDQISKRTHTICPSFRNDLNAGLQLPDIPNIAATIMQQDKKGVGINTQDILPVCDSNINQ